MLHYIEYQSGYCTIVRAETKDEAREKAGDGTRVPGDRQRLVRPATADDLASFQSMGGTVR